MDKETIRHIIKMVEDNLTSSEKEMDELRKKLEWYEAEASRHIGQTEANQDNVRTLCSYLLEVVNEEDQ